MPSSFTRIGCIGCGHMGGALVRAIAATSPRPELYLSSRDPAHAAALAAEVGGHPCKDNAEVVRSSELILLGVRPAQYPQVLAQIADLISCAPADTKASAKPLLVCMAAGFSLAETAAVLSERGVRLPLIRIMPNTPVEIGLGLTAYCPAQDVEAASTKAFRELFSATGRLVQVEENQFDAVTAVSGSGPAYVYQFIQSFIDAACALGLNPEQARSLVLQTVRGAAGLLDQKDLDSHVSIKAVCSPGGTTIAGMQALDPARMDLILRDATAAAAARSKEMSQPA